VPLSWEATSYVKRLERAPNGVPITRSEKLLLLILADYHNTEQRCAWPSAHTLAKDALLTVRHVRRVIASAKQKQILCVTKRLHPDGDYDSNSYLFHALDCGSDHEGGSDIVSPPSDAGVTRVVTPRSRGSDTATSPRVVTPVSPKQDPEGSTELPFEGSHTQTSSNGNEPQDRVCAKSKFPLEYLRQYAWASYNLDRRLVAQGEKNVDGIRNPEGWAIAAHRSGVFDALVQELVDNPRLFD
jgi:Helix-turn-helix domain